MSQFGDPLYAQTRTGTMLHLISSREQSIGFCIPLTACGQIIETFITLEPGFEAGSDEALCRTCTASWVKTTTSATESEEPA